MSHHANDGSASRIHRALVKEYGYTTRGAAVTVIAVAQDQAGRCACGEHDEAVAEKGHVTRLAFGKRVEPGTRYCRYCSAILPGSEEVADAGRADCTGEDCYWPDEAGLR